MHQVAGLLLELRMESGIMQVFVGVLEPRTIGMVGVMVVVLDL